MFSRYLGCPNSIGVHIVDVVVPIPLATLGQRVETIFHSMQADKVRRPARQPQYADRMRRRKVGGGSPLYRHRNQGSKNLTAHTDCLIRDPGQNIEKG